MEVRLDKGPGANNSFSGRVEEVAEGSSFRLEVAEEAEVEDFSFPVDSAFDSEAVVCMHGLEFEVLEYGLFIWAIGHQLYSMDL